MEDNFYQFTARSLQGREISMDTYEGKANTLPEKLVRDIEKLLNTGSVLNN